MPLPPTPCRLLLLHSFTLTTNQITFNMLALSSLGLDGPFENPTILGEDESLHEWVIKRIKEKNLNYNSVTNGLLYDLLARLVVKKNQHGKDHDPKRQLTKAQVTHIVAFMICRMGLDEVTPKIVRGVWNYIPQEEPPNSLWAGIAFIKKRARGGAPITGECVSDGVKDDNVGGAGGGEGSLGGGAGDSVQHVADGGGGGGEGGVGKEAVVVDGQGDRDAQLGGAGEVARQPGETGDNIMMLFLI